MENLSEFDRVNVIFTQLTSSGVAFESIDAFFCGFMVGRHNISALSIIEYTLTIINEFKQPLKQKENRCSVYENVCKSYLWEQPRQDSAPLDKRQPTIPAKREKNNIYNEIGQSPNKANHHDLQTIQRTSSSSSSSPSSSARSQTVCPICLEEVPSRESFILRGCKHSYHNQCILSHLESEINNRKLRLDCPDCHCKLTDNELSTLLTAEMQAKLSKVLRDLYLETHPDEAFYCACGHANWIKEKKTVIQCEKCQDLFCFWCRRRPHPGAPCQGAYEADHSLNLENLKQYGIASCPGCRRLIQKDEGCNQIRCLCQTLFCFNCGIVNGNGSYCKCPLFASSEAPDLSHMALARSSFAQHDSGSQFYGTSRMEEEIDHGKSGPASSFTVPLAHITNPFASAVPLKPTKEGFFILSSDYFK